MKSMILFTILVLYSTYMWAAANDIVFTQRNATVNLGVLITQNSTNPVPIFLPAGASFILCPTAGTFTINAVEQVAG